MSVNEISLAEKRQPATVASLLEQAYEQRASDVHLTPGSPPLMRLNGVLTPIVPTILKPEDTIRMAKEVFSAEQLETLNKKGEVDFAYTLPGVCRFRGNAFRQRRQVNMAFRVLSSKVPTLEQIRLPDLVKDIAAKNQGLVLVTGPTGSGKSTTLAAILNYINETQHKHIITLEDPIEYIHSNKKCLIAQREIGTDTISFASGLRAALRQDPDIILVGEMRDLETIRIA
ncbi:MAG TPA: ATPase, T2SS/T4P/T4SS family, partial [Paenibacillaceae bacterium]